MGLVTWEDLAFAHWLDEVEKKLGRMVDEALASGLFAREVDVDDAVRALS